MAQPKEPFVGIDLGTTNSVVATVDGATTVVIRSRQGAHLTPSVVYIEEGDGQRLVGEVARRKAYADPVNAAHAVKRLIGRTGSSEVVEKARSRVPYRIIGGPEEVVRVWIGGREFAIPDLAAMVLTELRLDAEAHFGRAVKKAVITVPANFNDGQRQATKDAATIAGFEVLRLVNEPTAAALAYGFGRKYSGTVVVFDLGGGTFDVSVLDVADGVFKVLSTGGDSFLGGEDLDLTITDWLAQKLRSNSPDLTEVPRDGMQRLKAAAEEAKIVLSEREQADVLVPLVARRPDGEGVDLHAVLTRQALEVLAEPMVRRCAEISERVVGESGRAKSDIRDVLLVGGMTRMPLVRRVVTEVFGRPPSGGVNPDEVVAMGAAVEAASLTHATGGALLLDVASQPLGVVVAGGFTRTLIAKNASVPCTAKEVFHPGHDGQVAARIVVVQGESDRADRNERLGHLVLQGLPGKQRSDVPIEVTFAMGADGILDVSAKETTSGLSRSVRIEARPTVDATEHQRLTERERQYHEKTRAEDAKQQVEALRALVAEAERLLPAARQAAESVPEAKAGLTMATNLLARVQPIADEPDPTAVAENLRSLQTVVASLKVLARPETDGAAAPSQKPGA